MVVSTIKRLLKENKKEELRYFKTLVYISIYPNRNPNYSFRDADDFIQDVCRNPNTFYGILAMLETYEDYKLFGHIVKEESKNILGHEYRKTK